MPTMNIQISLKFFFAVCAASSVEILQRFGTERVKLLIIPRLRFAGIKGQQMRKVQLPAESPCGGLWRRRDSTRSRRMGRRPHRFRAVISCWQTWWVSRRRAGAAPAGGGREGRTAATRCRWHTSLVGGR